jgi:ketosteroid isomerase-like protein
MGMMARHMVRTLVAVGILLVSSAAQGQDVAALKASFEAEIDALNSRKLDAALTPVDDRAVLFGIFSPFPIEGKEGYRQAVQEYFDRYEYTVLTPIDPAFAIVGTTGVAWGNFRLATKPKNGPHAYSDGRYMLTYTRANGQWRIISMHYSLLEPLVR